MNEFYERINNLSQKRLVLLAMELQSKLEAAALERSAKDPHEPIAVIGMACRFPGGANSPEDFWQLLVEGRDAVTEIPRDRWDIDIYYDSNVEATGKMSTRWGGFMSQVDQFDPGLFGITPREAMMIDPQQRIILEVCWEALERAGYAPDQLLGSSTGVFVGACNGDYGQWLLDEALVNANMYLATGGADSVISGRVSYVLGLQGPSISVDTACSSSLVSTNYAIRSLRAGECDMALAGGVNAILKPDVTVTLSKANMMAADGRCKAFDAAADGFVRSEGCGILVLKRLSDAEAAGDNILAVIRGTAINQDGRSNGLTAPNGPSQVSVIQAALADSGLEPADITYVETHGTGTSLGDPIEAQALGAAFSSGHSNENPLMIGSVKTNLGHLESAAGAAGLIKLILALQHGEIPPHLHLKELSPHIAWDELPLTIPTTLTAWKPKSGKRIGGVSSFGFSGTNVHMILEAYESETDPQSHVQTRDPSAMQILTISAKSEKSLSKLASHYANFIEKNPDIHFADMAYAANTTRAHLSYRLAIVAAKKDQALQKLTAFISDPFAEDLIRSSVPVTRPPDIVFLFTGHGAQYHQMGATLYKTEPVFRRVLDECNELGKAYLEKPLLSAIFPGDDDLDLLQGMTYTQPALYALQVALAELWRSWGVQPAIVAGHSLGEYAAAVAAGIFSLSDGFKLVATRGRLMDETPQTGSMAAIFTTKEQVSEIIQPYKDDLSIAVINAPTNIVISGITPAIEAVLADCEHQEIKTRRLAVAQAAHSPLIDPVLDEFEQIASTVKYDAPRVDLISCTTGQTVSADEITNPQYWRRHLRHPVQFAQLLETLQNQEQNLFVEIGPHPVLLSIGQRVFPTGQGVWIPSLREGFDDTQIITEALGMLFVNGVEINWDQFYGDIRRPKIILPTYAFDHQRYWLTPTKRPAGFSQEAVSEGNISPLLGVRIYSPALESIVFETQLAANWPPYLDHHRIFGTSIAPSPAYIEMAFKAAEEVFGVGLYRLSNLTIYEALILPEDRFVKTQTILEQEGEELSFKIVSRADNEDWKTHATGRIFPQQQNPSVDPASHLIAIEEAKARCSEEITGPDYYSRVEELGLEFGESFRGLQHIWRRDSEAIAKIQLPEQIVAEARNYHFHPALLDACFHLLGAPLPGGEIDHAYLLIGIDQFRLFRSPGEKLWNHTELTQQASETFTGNIHLYNESGELVAEIEGLQLKRASRELLLRAVHPRFDHWFYSVDWQAQSLQPDTSSAQKGLYILPDQGGFAQILTSQLETDGQFVQILQLGDGIPKGSIVLDLSGLDSQEAAADSETLLAEQVSQADEVIKLLKRSGEARIWIITRGAQYVNGTIQNPQQATLWGLGRVIALEHPDNWGGLIDLDPDLSLENQAAFLLKEIRSESVEDQVAFRQEQRFVARLTRTTPPTTEMYSFSSDRAYLITGGLGGLGLVTAQWFAQQGAKYLVLISRHGLPPRDEWDSLPGNSLQADQVATIKAIEATGTKVDVAAVDIGDYNAAKTLLSSFGHDRPQLKGILHAAAALDNRSLTEISPTQLKSMFWPKLAGTLNLHSLTENIDLDFFILFSSTTALWGSSQLGHYAAANTFLDSFAHYRNSLGLPALSINWGTWEVMRAASEMEQARVAQFGMEQMPTEATLSILGDLINSDYHQVAIADVDWDPLKAAYETRRVRPFLEQVGSSKADTKIPTSETRASLADQIQGLEAAQRREFIVEHVRQQVAKVISAPDPAGLDIRQGLFEMGLDSLMSVELKGKLESSVKQPLPSTLTFNYPTIDDLARYLDESVLPSLQTTASVPDSPSSSPHESKMDSSEFDDLSEDDIADLLASKLSKLK